MSGALADRQHGVVSRAQLLAAGIGRGAIARGAGVGRLRVVFGGVYAVGHVALSREGWWMAALLACGKEAALSHRTAAMVWGLLACPDRRGCRRRRGTQARGHRDAQMPFDRFDVLVIDNLRVTTPSRAIVDVAAMLEGRALSDVLERAQDLGRFDREDMGATLARGPRRPGTRRVQDLITLMTPDSDRARSHLERLFLALTRKARLPKPEANHEIAGRSRDLAWPAQRLVVETDGYRYHSSRRARRRDNRRSAAHGSGLAAGEVHL